MSQTLEYLLQKYGLLLSTAQIGEVLQMKPGSVSNRLSSGNFPLTGKIFAGSSKPYFRAADVAKLIDGEGASAPMAVEPVKKKVGRKSNAERAADGRV